MHREAYEFVRQHVRSDVRSVLELGSLDINGSARYLFPARAQYVGVDLQSGRGVDVVADAAAADLLSQLAGRMGWHCNQHNLLPGFDVVLCTEVLEHATDPDGIMRNARGAVRRGGQLIVTCATEPRVPHSATDGGMLQVDEYYHNVEEAELFDWLLPFASIGLTKDRIHGDLYAVAVRP